ncbi:MAG TPA: hypothetical protein VFG69_16960 [Nannocystaceae bacterium]|nr:hypothetical protein [Nannocystaceae bacterium]
MVPNRAPFPLPQLGCDPIRLHAADDTDPRLRGDLAVSREARAVGIDYAAVADELLALLAGEPARDACG